MSQENVLHPILAGAGGQEIDIYEINELESLQGGSKLEKAEENVARFSLLGDHISRLFALKSHSLHALAEIKAQQKISKKIIK